MSAVKIKPLVWVGEGSKMSFATTAIGDFKCQYASHANKWSAALNSFSGFAVGFAWFDTFEEAKAACEAEYERRVRECLEL